MPDDKTDRSSQIERSAQKVQDAYLRSLGEPAPPAAAATDTAAPSAAKTKTQLLAEAKAADIDGRSKMDKDALIAALAEHSRRASADTPG